MKTAPRLEPSRSVRETPQQPSSPRWPRLLGIGRVQRRTWAGVGLRVVWSLCLLLTGAVYDPLQADDYTALQLVESFPIETSLDHDDLPDAHVVWEEMIHSASTTLDFAEFYASNEADSRLERIVQAIEAAAARGVRVRFLAEERFYKTYPETLNRLALKDGITVRRFDVASLSGGVLHAKYFIVDEREVFVGSQNFDWRALTHIQELGIRFRSEKLALAFVDLFETDWMLAGGSPAGYRTPAPAGGYDVPVEIPYREGLVRVTPVFSPTGWLPDERLWDLPKIVDLLDSAAENIRLQLLTYRSVSRDSTYFETLESALRRAAARGVHVQMLLADWGKRSGTIEGLQSLQVVPNIEVRLVTIPEWSGGFIPFARVIHAKYLVVDGSRCWLGTSNWERDYFYGSRNAGLIVEGTSLAGRLERFFIDNWDGPYAESVDPCGSYEAPRIGN